MQVHAIIRLCLAYVLGALLLTPQVATRAIDTYVVANDLDYARNTDWASSSVSLHKRGVLEDLWNSVDERAKVSTGLVKAYGLDPKNPEEKVYAPTEFYGCTLVVIASSNGVLIGHFVQEKTGAPDCLLDEAASNAIVDDLVGEEAMVDLDNLEGTRAWIVYSDDISRSSVGYRKIFDNLNNEERLNIPAGNITPIPYRRDGGGGNSDKIAVQVGPADGDEGLRIKVYVRSDNPTVLTFDEDGEVED